MYVIGTYSCDPGFVLADTMEDRFLHAEAKMLVDGHCLVLDPASGEQIVACCFQVLLKTSSFLLLHRIATMNVLDARTVAPVTTATQAIAVAISPLFLVT